MPAQVLKHKDETGEMMGKFMNIFGMFSGKGKGQDDDEEKKKAIEKRRKGSYKDRASMLGESMGDVP